MKKQGVRRLRVYALRGLSGDKTMVLGWVHNRAYNFIDVSDPEDPPAGITDATIHFTGLTNGTWTVKWYNTETGAQLGSSGTATASGGNLTLTQSEADGDEMPTSIDWDCAFIMTK